MEKTPNHSRRDFFAHLTAFGVAGLVGSRSDFAGDSLDLLGGERLAQLRPEDFAKHVGQTFAIHDGARRLEAELIQVERRPRGGAPGMSRERFSVIFRVLGIVSVPHQIYTVEHALMGKFDLFLGAVGQPSASSARLEAVFA